MYRDDIFIERISDGSLIIGIVESPAEIKIPFYKDKGNCKRKQKEGNLKNLQPGNTFWAVTGVILGTIAEISTIVHGGGILKVMITCVVAANTVWSNSYSIYLDLNERDNEMDLDTLINNPLKFRLGKFFEDIMGDKKVGHTFYYGLELFSALQGQFSLIKDIKIANYFRVSKIKASNPILGYFILDGMKNNLLMKKSLFDIYQTIDAGKGILESSKEFYNTIQEIKKENNNEKKSQEQKN